MSGDIRGLIGGGAAEAGGGGGFFRGVRGWFEEEDAGGGGMMFSGENGGGEGWRRWRVVCGGREGEDNAVHYHQLHWESSTLCWEFIMLKCSLALQGQFW